MFLARNSPILMSVCAFFYLFVVFTSMSVNNLLTLMFLLEATSWVISILLKENSSKYLLVQAYFLLVSLLGLIEYPNLLILSFLFKLGFPPFHLWFVFLVKGLRLFVMSVFLTLHKILPLMISIKIISLSLMLASGVFLITGATMIMLSSNMLLVFIFSTLVHSVWMLAAGIFKVSLMMVYVVVYTVLIQSLIISLSTASSEGLNLKQTSMSNLNWLSFSGFPPFSVFWLKVNVFNFFIWESFFASILFMLVSGFSLSAYFRCLLMSVGVPQSTTMATRTIGIIASVICFF